MKHRILLIAVMLLGSQLLFSQHSLYDMHFGSSEDRPVTMSDYKGKKTLIVVAGPASLQAKSSARYLGDIQKKYPAVSVVIIPVADSSHPSADPVPKDKAMVANTRYSALVASKEKERHPLLQWLSDSKQNHHFDVTLKNDEQFFVISESGVLYAVLEKGVSDAILKEVLTAKDVQPQQVVTDINRKGYTSPR